MTSLLEIKDLTIEFQSAHASVRAVNGVTISVPEGRAVAIVGESGSGKSTCMMAVPNLLPKHTKIGGSINFDGRDILSMSEKSMQQLRGREIGLIFQNPTAYLNPIKTVGQQLIEPLLYHHMASAKTGFKRAAELLERVGIPDPEDHLRRFPFEFSGGMIQRAMLAMGLICGPRLLIADEPTTAIDVTVQAEILILLKELQRERGMSMVFITHDLAVAAQVADEIYVMYGGLVMEHLPATQLMTQSSHPYLRGLLESIPKIDGERGKLKYIPGQPVNTQGTLPIGCVFANRCVYRTDVCSKRPPLETHKQDHEVACWMPQEGELA